MHYVNRARCYRSPTLCAALILALSNNVAAQLGQGKLSGVVTDQASGEPLAGAQVYLEGTGIGGLTRENGRYFIINVPPGTYTLMAELIGYTTMRRENVLVAIDVTRTVDFAMRTAVLAVDELVVAVERTPLIETAATGAASVITASQIEALPVADLTEVLALQHGFLVVPQNTDVISYLDTRRGVTPVRIRGGRASETLTLVDGIPINNFLLGGPSFYLSDLIVEQLDYIRGGFPPKYGNALSGIINIKTREPGSTMRGTVKYQTSAVAGALGNRHADLLDYDQVEGYVAGPVPGTRDKLRFVVSARNWSQADRVLQFDDDIMNPVALTYDERQNSGSVFDLVPGWQAVGFDDRRDLFGKLAFYFTPTARLSLSTIDYQRQTKPYDFQWLQAGFDLYGQCTVAFPGMEDVCRRTYLEGVNPERLIDLRYTLQENQWTLQGSIEQHRRLWALNWDHTVGRAAYNVAVGGFHQARETCVILSGICLGSRLGYTTINGPFRRAYGGSAYDRHPIFGTDDVVGEDRVDSRFLRGDAQWQASDHHNLAAGLFYQRHDVIFTEVGRRYAGVVTSGYAGKPWDAAFYLQDRIEYDFVTVDLGFRLDYGKAGGLFYADPRDPTNGTTAYEACEYPRDFGLPDDRFSYFDPATGETFTGITACAKDVSLMELAVAAAMEDDFTDAKTRTQFSPRLGISFPVTSSSSLFFNYGRFSQNPIIHNLYRSTGIGLWNCPGGLTADPSTECASDPANRLEGSRNAFDAVASTERFSPLVGNPSLVTEATSSFELGFLSDIGEDYALSAILYTKDQYGLTGLRAGGVGVDGVRVFDAGGTYGTNSFDYQVLLNLDYQTVRGIEISLMRRVARYWGFDLRYHFSRVRTNAAAPELEVQKRDEGDEEVREEIRSEIDQPHVFNGVFTFQTGEDRPEVPGGSILKNTTLSLILRAASGLPYTPIFDEDGSELVGKRNTGTSPMTWRVDMLLAKDFSFRGVDYGFFMRVTNLFNTRNCIRVFPSTGHCDGGAVDVSRIHGFGGNWTTDFITQAWDRPDYLGEPRWASFGLRVSF